MMMMMMMMIVMAIFKQLVHLSQFVQMWFSEQSRKELSCFIYLLVDFS